MHLLFGLLMGHILSIVHSPLLCLEQNAHLSPNLLSKCLNHATLVAIEVALLYYHTTQLAYKLGELLTYSASV